ncbi:MmcQ/YjbR family DNA-binding protein [Kutzneria kofuensis]|uniref:Putative DNA-binding protein (MmcQ/YjbR family) n=1 Tax=Kutzneria kofuensis TaxID=103725 RepID=A0A7W9KEB4_9PSEU|nr:MmcQ/YjbR family DNA-binding protein [Kutzneria kofuensis]MBB5890971.1 putative DNA-binding protein (MmcQ/YjbR family) [Kutzneria kofuensis]
MTPAEVAAYALQFPQVTEENPFGPGLDVYKVEGKVFAILSPSGPSVSLKCEPSLAMHLRQQFDAVTPGYHLNKKHWNTVRLDGDVPPDQVEEMIEHSYERVVAGLPKAVRLRLR